MNEENLQKLINEVINTVAPNDLIFDKDTKRKICKLVPTEHDFTVVRTSQIDLWYSWGRTNQKKIKADLWADMAEKLITACEHGLLEGGHKTRDTPLDDRVRILLLGIRKK